MVAARAGPVPHPPPPARNWRTRARERLSRRSADDGDGLSPGRRILFVVQRYGREVAGGAELHCREFATRLAGRGHHVEVLTSRATSADGWDNVYPAGDEELDGVTVHRLGVDAPRNNAAFETMTAEVLWSGAPPSLAEQEEWRLLQGPTLPGLAPWLEAHAQGFDVVVHFSYLFATTWAGLPVSGRAAPRCCTPPPTTSQPSGSPPTTRCSRCRLGSLGPPRRNVSCCCAGEHPTPVR